jgi:hypothetical protein
MGSGLLIGTDFPYHILENRAALVRDRAALR